MGPFVACVAGVRKERGRELGRETTPLAFLSRLKLPFPKHPFIPFQTPATQARPFAANVIGQVVRELALNLPGSVISITILYLVTSSRRDLIILDL